MTKLAKPGIAGVISSPVDFGRAIRMRCPPDFFELRLDAFAGTVNDIKEHIEKLGAEVIITARHPREGGVHALSTGKRRALLLSFLPQAGWIDIELRSVPAMTVVLEAARERGARTILSFHDFQGTPSAKRLNELARRAYSVAPDLFKVAVRTDRQPQLDRLLEFFEHHGSAKIVAMGIGKLGRKSRLELARRGCRLNYAHLGAPAVEGQLSVAELRRALR